MKTIKQDTWLPLFTGYYHSIFDCSERYIEYETDLSDKEIKDYYPKIFEADIPTDYFKENFYSYLDYRQAENGCSEYIADGLIGLDHSEIIVNVKYQKTVNPAYYNFSTDSINVEIEYNPKKLKAFIKENKEAFKEYIENKYTSYDGFSSSYSNDVHNWIDLVNKNELGEHELGSVLEFVFEVNYGEDNEGTYELYDISNCYEGYSNSMSFDTDGMIADYKLSIIK